MGKRGMGSRIGNQRATAVAGGVQVRMAGMWVVLWPSEAG